MSLRDNSLLLPDTRIRLGDQFAGLWVVFPPQCQEDPEQPCLSSATLDEKRGARSLNEAVDSEGERQRQALRNRRPEHAVEFTEPLVSTTKVGAIGGVGTAPVSHASLKDRLPFGAVST